MSDAAWGQAAAEVREQLDRGERPRGPAMKRILELARGYTRTCGAARELGAEAEEIAQDVLASNLDAIVRARQPGAFFFTIFSREVISTLRHLAVERRAEPSLKRDANMRQRQLHETQDAETRALLREAADLLAQLTPRQREIVLAIAAGENRRELAARLGTSSGNIDQIFHRACLALSSLREEKQEER